MTIIRVLAAAFLMVAMVSLAGIAQAQQLYVIGSDMKYYPVAAPVAGQQHYIMTYYDPATNSGIFEPVSAGSQYDKPVVVLVEPTYYVPPQAYYYYPPVCWGGRHRHYR